jgi:flagellar biosynthesis/type III secretory pathway protein FliH
MISGFVDTYLRLTAEEMKQYKVEVSQLIEPEREEVMEIVTSWMEERLQQGLQQGRQEATVSLVMRQLKHRLGLIEAPLLDQVQRLSLEQLEALSEALLDFASVADLREWLTAHHP